MTNGFHKTKPSRSDREKADDRYDPLGNGRSARKQNRFSPSRKNESDERRRSSSRA